jgi:NIMA (never in mitosis gene a)-related kinase
LALKNKKSIDKSNFSISFINIYYYYIKLQNKIIMLTMDQFDVLETIGSGAFGKVYKIRRKSDAKILVWKEIDFGKMSEKEKSQLVAEVNILRDLRNPFIVRYYDRIVDKPSTKLYLIMEYCQGGDLGMN